MESRGLDVGIRKLQSISWDLQKTATIDISQLQPELYGVRLKNSLACKRKGEGRWILDLPNGQSVARFRFRGTVGKLMGELRIEWQARRQQESGRRQCERNGRRRT